MIAAADPDRAGYSLVEVMVVLAIIGLMTGAAYLTLRPDPDPVRAAAEQLQLDLAAAETLAITRGEFIGLRVSPDGYDFLIFSENSWTTLQGRRGLTGRRLADGISLDLSGSGTLAAANAALPDYWFDPTGANDTAMISIRDGDAVWQIRLGSRDGIALRGDER